jgi:hypothetical protein
VTTLELYVDVTPGGQNPVAVAYQSVVEIDSPNQCCANDQDEGGGHCMCFMWLC